MSYLSQLSYKTIFLQNLKTSHFEFWNEMSVDKTLNNRSIENVFIINIGLQQVRLEHSLHSVRHRHDPILRGQQGRVLRRSPEASSQGRYQPGKFMFKYSKLWNNWFRSRINYILLRIAYPVNDIQVICIHSTRTPSQKCLIFLGKSLNSCKNWGTPW